MDKHLFLLGFMGAGKSYLGQKLALGRGLPFYDLDQLIENQTGSSIPVIFESLGADAFRQLEATQLRTLEQLPPGIVAVGGGTPCFYDNLAWMNAQGQTVYIKVPVPILLARLEKESAQRPVLAGKVGAELERFVVALLAERAVYYEQADMIWDMEGPEEFNTIFNTKFSTQRHKA
jgi:shikimate kinase